MWILVVLIIVIFIMLTKPPVKYSWKDLKLKFADRNIEYAAYDFSITNDEYGNPHEIKTTNANSFFSKRDIKSCMLKIKQSEKVYEDILNYVRPVCTHRDNSFALRIQKGPWYWTSHFDCVDQICHILDGHKKWVTYEVSFDTAEEEKSFVDIVGYITTLDELTTYLNFLDINYKVVDTRPGDHFFIKAGVYHAVEGVGNHIMVNEYVSDDYMNLTPKFSKIWKRWYTKDEKY